jgi:3',5'-nucleoside bisphosphate phosphatase
MRIDLHVHSNNSDGAFPPADVARIAREENLDVIALTDHDSTAGVAEAQAAGESLGLDVIAGCEVSAVWAGGPCHVLGYWLDTEHARLNQELALIRDDRLWRAERIVEKLQGLGIAVTFERVKEIAKGESVGRPHIAQAMVEAGVVGNTRDAFTPEWIADKGRAYVEKRALTPEGAVELINEAGGVAVLAHAIWLHDDPEGLIRKLKALGMAGLEVDHPDHDAANRERFGALAKQLDLVPTGSSDWHGNAHGGKIGENTTAPEALERLRERRRKT